MPVHPDAIGYLNDLRKDVGEPWFAMICDLVTINEVSVLDKDALESLHALFTERASYLGIRTIASTPTVATPTAPTDRLERLSGFLNFKLLSETLDVEYKKRITLIFGANGSGKSS